MHPPDARKGLMNTDEDQPIDGQDAPPEVRLSWWRLAVLLVALAAIAGGSVLLVRAWRSDDIVVGVSTSVPYVDVTLTPTYAFQDPQSNPARSVALAFVVADPDDACAPSWGGYYSLAEADAQLELSRRLAQLRNAGGDAIVSFGGQANDELALGCEDADALTDAYLDVVTHYDLTAIDLDLEGDELSDAPSIERRATAIAAAQAARTDADRELAVWLTLPVAASGLTSEGAAALDAMLAAGVELAGVNTMTMNFASAEAPTDDMFAATERALERTADQLVGAYAKHGVHLAEGEVWSRLGATPMIGQNDVDGEVFTLDDASDLAGLAARRGLGRVSFWSLNRDSQCDSAFPDVAVLSDVCSGVAQDRLEFAVAFSTLGADRTPTRVESTVPPRVDDPATSPYPVWRSRAEYEEGYKVVRRGFVYQARWYTSGVDPAAIGTDPNANPWSLVGPVGPADEPFVPATVAPGTHPEWDPTVLYQAGDDVVYRGLPYQARWANQAETPETQYPVAPSSAWEPQFEIAGEPAT